MAWIILTEFPLGDAVHRHSLDRLIRLMIPKNEKKKQEVWFVWSCYYT